MGNKALIRSVVAVAGVACIVSYASVPARSQGAPLTVVLDDFESGINQVLNRDERDEQGPETCGVCTPTTTTVCTVL